MKRAKQRRSSPRRLYLGWDGKLHVTPLSPNDPTLGQLIEQIKQIREQNRPTRPYINLPRQA